MSKYLNIIVTRFDSEEPKDQIDNTRWKKTSRDQYPISIVVNHLSNVMQCCKKARLYEIIPERCQFAELFTAFNKIWSDRTPFGQKFFTFPSKNGKKIKRVLSRKSLNASFPMIALPFKISRFTTDMNIKIWNSLIIKTVIANKNFKLCAYHRAVDCDVWIEVCLSLFKEVINNRNHNKQDHY